MVTDAYNPITQEAEVEVSLWVWDQPGLHTEFKTTLNKWDPAWKKQIKERGSGHGTHGFNSSTQKDETGESLWV